MLKVDASAGSVTVSHEPVPGFMDAMVMQFTAASPEALAAVRPGDRIRFRLRVDGRSVIDRVKILSAGPATTASGIGPAGTSGLVPIGGVVPDFSLVNQQGAPVSLASLRGQVVVVSFIYTRCPLPDYCPRVMTNLSAIRDRFGEHLGTTLTLLTVTFDPTHDTPQQLRTYADRYGANVAGWHLLTGSPAAIGRVCSLFGMEFWPEEGMITHSLQTAVIDRDGRLAAIAEGTAFSTRQLADLVASILSTSNPEPSS
ncbi:MAG TPA: SCO family protein [Vicinamibacterales bacterium]|nr:SCO family protein [Vicinamibacterales bacterium]